MTARKLVTDEECMEKALRVAQPLLDVADAAEALLAVIEEPVSVQAPFIDRLRAALDREASQ